MDDSCCYTAPYQLTSRLVQDVIEGGEHLSTARQRVAIAEKYIAMERALADARRFILAEYGCDEVLSVVNALVFDPLAEGR
jgi:hypothetical protein